MEELKRQLSQMSEHNRKHYEYELSKLNEAEKQHLEALVVRMVKDGAQKPFEWAWSEFREGIPQWARFMILKGIYQSAYDVEGSISTGCDFQSDIEKVYQDISVAVGKEKLKQFLINYSKGMLYNMVGIFDEGNFDYENNDSWLIITHNRETGELGKPISGLHEDFLEFEQEIFHVD